MQASSGSSGGIQNRCPVDLHPLAGVRVHTAEEVEAAIGRARAAQRRWESRAFEERARLLRLAARRMLERRQEVLELLHDEAGKTPADALLSEAIGPLQYVKDWIRVARPCLRTRKLPISRLAFPGKRGIIEMVPRGVVGVISPWNYPLGNFFKPVFAALLCGNAVIIKPSENSPLTADWFAAILREVLPADVLTVVQGDRETAQALIRAGVDAVTFTGSFDSGREVARLAADRMIPCSVELGGKDAAIVLADCDIDRTVAGIMHWALQNTGQSCGDIERVYVEEAIADEFVRRLGAAVSRLRVNGDIGDSDLGPIANSRQLSIVQEHVADAIARGARLVGGGKPVAGRGLWFEPAVLDRCDHSMKVMREPTFGPIIPVVRVKNAAEGLALANDCEYGLCGSVWSRDVRRAATIARALRVGTAYVNNHAFTGAMAAAPWTGIGKSGYGVANSAFALNHYTRPRTLVIDTRKAADAWWLPMDHQARELGHRLAEAQLGKIGAVLRLPWLIAGRQRQVIGFVRDPRPRPGPRAGTEGGRVRSRRGRAAGAIFRLKGALFGLGSLLRPPLTRLELAWGQSAIEALFSGAEAEGLGPLPAERTRAFLRDLHRSLPFAASVAMRANLWIAGLWPILRGTSWRTIERLSLKDRVEVLRRLASSDSYLQRQVVILLKTNGALSQLATTRFHEAIQRRTFEHDPRESGPRHASALHAERPIEL